jgi:hypothetical protein
MAQSQAKKLSPTEMIMEYVKVGTEPINDPEFGVVFAAERVSDHTNCVMIRLRGFDEALWLDLKSRADMLIASKRCIAFTLCAPRLEATVILTPH